CRFLLQAEDGIRARIATGVQTCALPISKGIKDQAGRDASPLPAGMNRDEYGARVRARLVGQEVIPPPTGYQLFTPVIDTFLKERSEERRVGEEWRVYRAAQGSIEDAGEN